MKRVKALIYSALPPPVGGVASIAAMLYQSLSENGKVGFQSPAKKSSGFSAAISRLFINIVRLGWAIVHVKRGGRVLLFAGAGNSFFEKIIWSLLIMISGRTVAMVMVDGNFPIFWDKCSPFWRRISSRIVCHPQFTLGVQSEAWQDYYRRAFPSALIKVVGATAAPEFFSHTPQAGLPSRGMSLLYVGWIIPEKGITDLLDAMVILIKTHPEVRLRLVGPLFGKDEYWNKAVADRGISTQVKFTGPISDRSRLIKEFDNASVFVFPSHFEGFPVALLEAITMGLACVGTTVGGIPDILDHGRAGIVVSPHAPQELANALKSLFDDNELIEKYSKQAAMRARSIYSHSECIESYKRLLGLE
ncbi:MAG TPA: glycosyltransferase family 4 protein [Gallionellaceae bacterium]|nr:glycosyltransferase family 4 protein [Gallionellaceae bacterium]HQS75762.1 glycosyltransferase family 4 protein [Gallionellaceae bacterium]